MKKLTLIIIFSSLVGFGLGNLYTQGIYLRELRQ